MATLLARCLSLGLAATLAASVPALGQSSPEDRNRSDSAQSDDQATNNSQQSDNQRGSQYDSPQDNPNSQQDQDQNAQSRQNRQDDSRGRFFDRGDDEQSRRGERQDQRQDRRQDGGRFGNRDRQPAIGVTVVERGGMGVRVMAVVPESPASQAGIRPGDTILEVEGRTVGTAQQLVALIQDQEAGDTAEFAVIREGREYQVPVRLATREQALPARLRRQDGSQERQSQQFGQSNQPWQQQGQDQTWQQDQNRWQQGQYGDQPQQPGQQQYDRSQYGQQQQQNRQFNQQDQYQQGRAGPPRPASPYTSANNQDSGSTQQAYYGGQGSDYSRQSQYTQDSQRQPVGERLVQRLSQFEERLERITQRLDQIERNGGIRFQAGSTDSSQTSPSQQTDASQSSADEDHGEEHKDEQDSGEDH
jgi:hypothetical protein